MSSELPAELSVASEQKIREEYIGKDEIHNRKSLYYGNLPKNITVLNDSEHDDLPPSLFARTLYTSDAFNLTAPDLLMNDSVMQSIHEKDAAMREVVNNSALQALVGQDEFSLEDAEREILMRQKRKDDAYKTALCDSYRRTNMCNFGEKCRFAHGVDELRLPQAPRGRTHPKYKTVLCDKFSSTGFCKYGSRCQFIHKITNVAVLNRRRHVAIEEEDDILSEHRHVLYSSDFSRIARMNYLSTGPSMLNQSMPVERRDVDRALARTGDSPSITRLSRAIENRTAAMHLGITRR